MLAAASSSDDDHDPAISQTRTDLAALKTLNDNVQMAIATSLVSREQYADAIKPLETYLATPRKDIGGEKARTALAICLAQNHRAEEAVRVLNELTGSLSGQQSDCLDDVSRGRGRLRRRRLRLGCQTVLPVSRRQQSE